MPMKHEELQALLQRLHHELREGSPISEALREPLATLHNDIEQALGDTAATASPAEGSQLTAQAQALEAQFAADHPVLASVLRDLMDRLGKMGI